MHDPRIARRLVVIEKEHGMIELAQVLRITWMRRMGLDGDEIAESIRDDPPVNVQEEMKQLKALDSLDKITPPAEVLRKFAIKY
jgi:hypothetical protein